MSKIKHCWRCSYFQGVSYVHPDSLMCKKEDVPAGWYVKCGDYYKAQDIAVIDPGSVKGSTGISYQALKKFMRINSNCRVDCPRPQSEEETKEKQISIFDFQEVARDKDAP